MQLFYAATSPFSAKVRMAAHHVGIALDGVATDTATEPDDLLGVNPLGKIPALRLDDGTSLYDSRVIGEWLDRRSGHRLIPQDDAAWRAARRFEATADGVVDAAILIVYEARYRPEERRHQPWMDRQWRKAARGLDVLEAELPALGDALTLAHFALAGLLGWMDIRFEGRWQPGHPGLVAFMSGLPARFPAYETLKPHL